MEAYIPNARDAVIAYFGATRGVYRERCVRCCDAEPLIDPRPIYGDLYIPTGDRERAEYADCCDACGVTMLALSEACQREHDEQQARWSRMARPDHVIEYGIPAAIRCRVY